MLADLTFIQLALSLRVSVFLALKTHFFHSYTQVTIFRLQRWELAGVKERLGSEEITAILLVLGNLLEWGFVPPNCLFFLLEHWGGSLSFQDAFLHKSFVVVANVVLVLSGVYNIV